MSPASRATVARLEASTAWLSARAVARVLRRRKAWVLAQCARGPTGAFPGALRAGRRAWRIPVADVEQASRNCPAEHLGNHREPSGTTK